MRSKQELNPYIFISYSHDDILFAKKLAQRLEVDGYAVWIDLSDIHGNEEFSAEIDKGIFECALFVSLLSKTYIKKPFCREEIECARNYHKELMPLHIEQVIIPPGSGFNLTFSKSQLGYGRDILSDDDFDEFYNNFVESLDLLFKADRQASPVKTNISFEALRQNFEQLSFGGYVVNEIYAELFPAITTADTAKGQRIHSSNNNQTLITYIEDHPTDHIFIKGDGGSGKTVALKHVFEDFLGKNIPTIYIPLNRVRFGDNDALQKYIAEIACKNAEWHNIKQLAMNNGYIPRVVLMLDGLNEITGDIRNVVMQISEMMLWPNLQIIITSRTDYLSEFSDASRIKLVKFQPVTQNTILQHLEAKGISPVTDKTLLHLLSNPMMLTLYTETKISAEYIQQIRNSRFDFNYFPIQVTENPDTAGKIIWNYIISQLYKVSNQTQSITDTINYFAAVEFIMPFLGYVLISETEKTSMEVIEYKKLLRHLKKTDYYEIYAEDRIEGFDEYSGMPYEMPGSGVFSNIMTSKLCFMKKSDNELEFSHQIFRDFFAALFIAKQIECLLPDKEENEYSDEAVTRQLYSRYIIEYLNDILEESAAKPKQDCHGIVYPGKPQKLIPSTFSIAENALMYFKGKEGIPAQTGITNLIEVMKLGRSLNLSNCDFSKLDLRLCTLMGTTFVCWYKDEIYPCSFDESYMNIESFISPGHTFPISAIGSFGEKIFTGDVNGTVKVWHLDSEYPLATYAVLPGVSIIGLAYSPVKDRLGILTTHALYAYDTHTMTAEILCETHDYYKYIKVDESGEFLISTDVEPLTWHNIAGREVCEELPFKVTCGCAAKNPVRDEFLIGLLYNNAMLFRRESDTNRYTVLRRIDLYNQHVRICDVCYHPDGTKFLVATNKTVSAFDSATMTLTHRIVFDGAVHTAKYNQDKILVACGVNLIVLNDDFSIRKKFNGRKADSSITVLLDHGKLYLCSTKKIIYELDENFAVRKSRRINTGNHVCIGNHGSDSPCFILINDNNKHESGFSFDFDTAVLSELAWNYEITTDCFNTEHFPYEISKTGNIVYFTNKQNPEDRKRFVFYTNIHIFACTFKNIQGNLKDNLEKVVMYGGIV